ncbi:hypothetical protein HX870_21340 [Pseudomonas gingeri]|uniref:hypothetical protein n=1 Tax=Pseudomonas gingeri TaxID=117681 RepID=UPI0015A3896E|nr:hypothetical protein [Pseudomonas gingeri]NWA25652.1 hypothetical protein [Pseudomonas gingeri]NWD70149.1 hypothetical protein [Pseudomonas gingeri]
MPDSFGTGCFFVGGCLAAGCGVDLNLYTTQWYVFFEKNSHAIQVFNALAKGYEGLSDRQIQQLLEMKAFVEIDHDQDI